VGVISVIAVATAALVGFVPTVIVGESLPGTPATPAGPGTKTARFDEGTIRYQDAGDGTHAILLLHGFNGHLGQWDGVWRELADCACRRIRIDLPGFGDSTWQTDAFGVPDQVERVIALLDRLGV
jgi:pimeloyl-ACP methyl ester carboxylesterase